MDNASGLMIKDYGESADGLETKPNALYVDWKVDCLWTNLYLGKKCRGRIKMATNIDRKGVMQKVDASKEGLQTGFVGTPPPIKEEITEALTEKEETEKLTYQKILRILVPEFSIVKLEKQTLKGLRKYIIELSPLIRDELARNYNDLSP